MSRSILKSVTVTFERFDSLFGEKHTITANISEDGSYEQWGVPRHVLGDNVGILTEMALAAANEWGESGD